MVNLGVKSQVIITPKKCLRCNETIKASSKMFYGHSGTKNPNGDCSIYVCEQCEQEKTGYIIECTCTEFL